MRKILTLALAAGALVGCASEGGEPTTFQLAEFAIEGPARLGVGVQSMEVHNVGEFPHTLVVTDETGTVATATSLIPSGESTSLELDLDPGLYSVTCRIVAQTPEGNIIDHFEAGMHSTLQISD